MRFESYFQGELAVTTITTATEAFDHIKLEWNGSIDRGYDPDSMRIEIGLEYGSQVVFVNPGPNGKFLRFTSAFGLVGEMKAKEALRLASHTGLGIQVDKVHYHVCHVVWLEHLDSSVIDWAIGVVESAADDLGKLSRKNVL
jgi:hypothetical protein